MLNQKGNNNIEVALEKEIHNIKTKNNKFFLSSNSFRDLTYLKTYTIDDSESVEIDDAISLERIGNKHKLWIHIASPAAHIDYNSNIDKSARKLVSTLYLTTNIIYMFPKSLIDQIFILTTKEKSDRKSTCLNSSQTCPLPISFFFCC